MNRKQKNGQITKIQAIKKTRFERKKWNDQVNTLQLKPKTTNIPKIIYKQPTPRCSKYVKCPAGSLLEIASIIFCRNSDECYDLVVEILMFATPLV